MSPLLFTRILLTAVLLALTVPARAALFSSSPQPAERSDSLIVSLLTCYPGPEVYQLYGHSAIRIQDLSQPPASLSADSVWNYGLFDFHAPNFLYRFVKGETDYMLGGYPFDYFLAEYTMRGSRVVEQELNLTQQQARALRQLLQNRALPANRTYRYNYVKDNCSTRILVDIDSVVGAPVVYPDTMSHATFRREMRAYDHTYPWYALGVDVALGSGLDYPLSGREDMFVPIEMMRKADVARMPDGTPLVRATHILVDGKESPILPPTPWYLTPLFWALVVLAFTVGVCAYDLATKKLSRWWFAIYFLLMGLAGLLVTFLVFVSEHEATSPNMLIWWLNPIALLVPMLIWVRKLVPVVSGVMLLELVAVGILLICWPFQTQSTNAALFPLMAATLCLAGTYAILSLQGSLKLNKGTRRAAPKRRTAPSKPRKRK